MKLSKIDIVILLITAIFFIAIPFCVDIVYDAADDARYMFLVSGAYTGEPCPYLVFEGILYGKFLAFMYTLLPTVEWYSVSFYILSLIAFLVISFSLLRLEIKEYAKYFLVLVIFIIHLFYTLRPQNTLLASELAFASLSLLLLKKDWKHIICSVILFFLGTQIRVDAALIPYMICFPLFFRNIQVKSRNFVHVSIVLAIMFIIAVGVKMLDKNAYDSQEWKEFSAYNIARGYIADNPLSKSKVSSIINEDDRLAYELLVDYRFVDRKIMPYEKIKSFSDDLRDEKITTIKWNVIPYFKMYIELGGAVAIILMILLLYPLFKKKKYKDVLVLSLSLLMFAVANVYMMSSSFPKVRVMATALLAILSVLFVLFYDTMERYGFVYVVLGVILAGTFVVKIVDVCESKGQRLDGAKELEFVLDNTESEKSLIIYPGSFSVEAFHGHDSSIGKKGVFFGWMYLAPFAPEKYKDITAFIDGAPIIVAKNQMTQLHLLQNMIERRYGISTESEMRDASNNYYVVHLKSISDENSDNDGAF